MSAWTFIVAVLLGGCAPPEPGFAWEVDLATARNGDTCHDPAVLFEDRLTYVLRFDGAAARVAVDGDDFATGSIAGCSLDYRSVIWSERRDDAVIRWQIEGEALFRFGASACEIEGGADWLGTETFTIIGSEHPDIEAGCSYTLDISGTYLGEWP